MNFLGFLRLYEVTGDASLLRKVRGAWDDVSRRQRYVTGGVSVGEHYEPGRKLPITGAVVETCASMSWMELTQALLELTGEVKYADAIERLMLNHVLAAQTIDGDGNRYHTPLNGFKPRGYFHGPDCCTGSGHRLLAKLPGFIYAQGGDGLYVNQFIPSAGQLQTDRGMSVKLNIQTRYPEEKTVVILVEPRERCQFALHVRIPGWCESPSLRVNNQAVDVTAGTYARLDRVWKDGDTVTVTLPMRARWVQRDDPGVQDKPWALVRGPVVYAIDTVWWDRTQGPQPYEIWSEVGCVRNAELRQKATATGCLGPFFETDVKLVSGKTARATLVPFANVGRWYQDPQAKPAIDSAAYSYAIWLQDNAGPEFAQLAQRFQKRRAMIDRSVDYVVIGDERSERAHKLAGTSSSGPFRNRFFRHAPGGNSFSYDLKVLTETPCDLVTTYWGGETGSRTFDILVNGRKVATQSLHLDKPGEFFDVRYPIPFDLIRGKTDALGQRIDHVTVTFQAHPGATAGGIFGLYVVKR